MSALRSPVYLDNAATSFPKPANVAATMDRLLRSTALSPGRSAHAFSLAAGREIFAARELLAAFFGCPDSSRLIFTANVTEALNVGLFGLLKDGGHVIATGMEHNSVMRPLRHLEQLGRIALSVLPASPAGETDPADLAKALRRDTRLIVVNHVSNVTGTAAPLAEIAALKGGALLVVDAAQSAGVFELDVAKLGIDFFAFTGHKALLGPTGTGGFVLGPDIELPPFKMGGTGSASEFEVQPDFAPDCYEAGTPNTLGIAGLAAGVGFVKETGLAAIREHEQALTRRFLDGLAQIREVTVYGLPAGANRGAVVSLRLAGKGMDEVAHRLDREFRILVRAGLHCAPLAHRTIGTFPEGTVRVSFGFFNTMAEVDCCLDALARIAAS
ncbi:MAG: aminotransferase class V-fold PLP-dependent enzyme [Thermodesulfobacteriota bacterium]